MKSRDDKIRGKDPYSTIKLDKLDINQQALIQLYTQAFLAQSNRIQALEILTTNINLRLEEFIKLYNKHIVATRNNLINILRIINGQPSRTM